MASLIARQASRLLAQVPKRASTMSVASIVPARGFAIKIPEEQGHIPDIEGLTGVARKEAVFRKVYGEELFDRDANIFLEEGTRENPIPILSTEAERVVGISLQDDSEIRWFTLRKGELIYDPDTCNFFALKQVTADEVEEWVKRAEKAAFGGK